MADVKIQVGGQDRARINLNKDYEIRDWYKSLGGTEKQWRYQRWVNQADNVREQLEKSEGPAKHRDAKSIRTRRR